VLEGELWEKQINRSIFDYLPIYADAPPAELAKERYVILEGDLEIKNYLEKSNKISFVTEVNQGSIIQLSQYYFPGWEVKVDGNKGDIDYDNELGLITLELKPGDNHVDVTFINTNIRTLANILTIFGFFLIVYMFYKSKSVKT